MDLSTSTRKGEPWRSSFRPIFLKLPILLSGPNPNGVESEGECQRSEELKTCRAGIRCNGLSLVWVIYRTLFSIKTMENSVRCLNLCLQFQNVYKPFLGSQNNPNPNTGTMRQRKIRKFQLGTRHCVPKLWRTPRCARVEPVPNVENMVCCRAWFSILKVKDFRSAMCFKSARAGQES